MRCKDHNAGPGRCCYAFTLIELLVVIAVLAVLAALLLPALGRGMDKAKKASCLNRLKQWQMALVLYADENDGWTPRESVFTPDTTLNFWTHVQGALAHDVWYNALPRMIDERPALSYAPSAVRQDFYDRSKLIHCPSAVFPRGAVTPGDTTFPIARFSYAMNSKLILCSSTAMKFTSIEAGRPSDTVTFLDNRLPGEPKVDVKQIDTELGQPSAYATRFVARHLSQGSLAFADGHAETRRGTEVVTNGIAHFPQTTVVWTADPSRDPNVDCP